MARIGGGFGGAQDNVKQLEDCLVSKNPVVYMGGHCRGSLLLQIALGTWFFSVAGALIAIPVGIWKKYLAPMVFFGMTGTMLDIIMGTNQCK